MKTTQIYILLLIATLLASCSEKNGQSQNTYSTQKTNQLKLDNETKTQIQNKLDETLKKIQKLKAKKTNDEAEDNFIPLDLSKIELTHNHLDGSFPYFDAPDGYLYSTSRERKNSIKYFFSYSGKLIPIRGNYFAGNISPKKETTADTDEVLNFYTKKIIAAGGVKIFEGKAPEALSKEYSKVAPPIYWRDMYNPLSANFIQYLINQPDKAIWIELAVNLGSTRIDFSVLQQDKTIQASK